MYSKLKKRIILGLDISTSCIGSTVASLDEDGTMKILEISHLRLKTPRKAKGTKVLFYKSEVFKEKLKDKYSKYYITDVIIEEPLISSNNVNTAATLMRFNGMISQSVRDVLGIIPDYISSFDARKFGCPSLLAVRKYNKHGEPYSHDKIVKSIVKNELTLFGAYPFDCSKKYILWNYISEKFPDIKWDYDSHNELRDENFDASDSLMCVLGYVNKCKYGDTEPEIVCCDSSNKDHIDYSVSFCGQTFSKTVSFE